MNLNPDDPQLTAYVLGELTAEEAADVTAAAEADPAIDQEIQEIRAVQGFLAERLDLPIQSLELARREAIFQSARAADRTAKFVSFRKKAESAKPWLIPAAAVAVLTFCTYILTRMPENTPPPKATAGSVTPSSDATPTVTERSPSVGLVAPEPAPFVPQGSFAAADTPSLQLPIVTEHGNLAAISETILNSGQLPKPESVRLEELLNAFPFRLHGITSIARDNASAWHPDTRDSGIPAHLATLSTELVACPWKPSAVLLLVSLRGNATQNCEINLTFHAAPQHIFRYRLLGFTATSAASGGKVPSQMPIDGSATYAIELEPTRPGTELGSLSWSINGNAAPSIPLTHNRDAEPSDDARFAALVCTFGQWLTRDQPAVIDAEVVAALARETASGDLPADRAAFLNLIDQALHR